MRSSLLGLSIWLLYPWFGVFAFAENANNGTRESRFLGFSLAGKIGSFIENISSRIRVFEIKRNGMAEQFHHPSAPEQFHHPKKDLASVCFQLNGSFNDGVCLIFVATPKSFADARAFCRSLSNGDLWIPNFHDTELLWTKLFTELPAAFSAEGSGNIWVGASVAGGDVITVIGQEITHLPIFRQLLVNHEIDMDDCIYINLRHGVVKFGGQDCTSNLPFICQFPEPAKMHY